MYDCQCDSGTYEFSYKIAGILIEEQVSALSYFKENKALLLDCAGMSEKQHSMFIESIEKGIEFNEKKRPYYLKQLFFGESQIMDITSYKEVRLDLIKRELEMACDKLKK